MNKFTLTFFYVALYSAANLLVAAFGVWITPFNALFIIAGDMVLRDRLQYNHGFWWSLFASVLAGVVTVLINPMATMIALACMSSIVLSGIGAAIVFKVKSGGFFAKSIPANISAAGIDSLVFPVIAFGSVMWDVSLAQFIAKVVGSFVILYIIKRFNK